MRILFCSSDLYGHALPLLTLARAFRALDHEVRFAVGTDLAPHLVAAGFSVRCPMPTLANLRAAMQARSGPLPNRGPSDRLGFAVAQFADTQTQLSLEPLLQEIDEWKPHLIVYECFAWAAPLAGTLRGVTSISHGFGMPLPRAVLDAHAHHLATTWTREGLAPRDDGGLFQTSYIDIWPEAMQRHRNDLCRGACPLPMRFGDSAHALHAQSNTSGRNDMRRILVTLGTLAVGASALMPPIIAACTKLKNAHVTFLMGTTLAAREVGQRMSELACEPSSSFSIHGWLDLDEALCNVDLMISHGGAGTVLRAASRGVRQLLLPSAADQFDNTDAAVSAGIALHLGSSDRSEPQIRAAIEVLLEDKRLREAAMQIAEDIQGMRDSSSVAATICSRLTS
jgi:UDP:flavonoid glycosyltransferase YjiC (YdhE family)